MKLIKIEAYVVDHGDQGPEEIADVLRHCDFGAVRVEAQAAEIGEWDDSHVLNMKSTPIDEFRKQFHGTATGYPLDSMEDNVAYMLEKCPFTVRDMSGERTGARWKEDLIGSLALTFLGMEHRLKEAEKRNGDVKLKTPTGEQLYITVCRNFKNGYFGWDIVPEQTKNAWSIAASDLLFSPDTIMGRFA